MSQTTLKPAGSGPIDPAHAKDRARASTVAVKAVSRTFQLWRLTNAEASRLMGISERTWNRMKSEAWSSVLSQDQLLRASGLIGIYKGLHLYFSEPLADEWIGLPNSGPLFQNRRPIDTMIDEGLIAIYRTRDYVDALRGGL
jgi:uncharacterized protein (DUF2384 family)